MVAEGAAEKIENITTNYGYWSDMALWKFDNVTGNSTRVPFDAHELVALVAPVCAVSFGVLGSGLRYSNIVTIRYVARHSLGRGPGGLVGECRKCLGDVPVALTRYQTNPEGSLGVVFPAAKVVFDWLGVGDNVGIHVRHPPDDLHCGLSA